MSYSVLVINPGSTSTKLALFSEQGPSCEESIRHPDEMCASVRLMDQLPLRENAILEFLARHDDARPDAVCGRGGPLRPLEGGTYAVDEAMLADMRAALFGEHASLLGGLLAHRLAARWGVPAFVVDPVSVDELDPVARVSGVPGIQRTGRSHALNLKAVLRQAAAEIGKAPAQTRFVAAHMGGGISVAALRAGRLVDVNDALLGMGPFSPYRSGALPLHGMLDLAFAPGADRKALEQRLCTQSGLVAYLGTGDLFEVEARVLAGDARFTFYFEAMIYQIAKEIGAMATALSGDLDGIIFTGGMSRCAPLVERLTAAVAFLGRIFIYPGENEMAALAQGALRVLRGEEAARSYAEAGVTAGGLP
jgi:butyrate kinase